MTETPEVPVPEWLKEIVGDLKSSAKEWNENKKLILSGMGDSIKKFENNSKEISQNRKDIADMVNKFEELKGTVKVFIKLCWIIIGALIINIGIQVLARFIFNN